jgi:phospholipid/cholesterol/gamma-HCH transport system substrate-binding protein
MTQTVRIGIFLGGALLIVAVGVFLVGDLGRFFRRSGYSIYAAFETVAGLDTRATVRLAGVSVGYVKAIRLEGHRPIVEMTLEPSVKVPLDSKAMLSSLGLLGEKYIEILPGPGASIAKQGDSINSTASVSFDQLGLLILSIGDEVKGVSGKVQKFLGEDNAARFGQVLDSLAQTSRSLDEFMRNNRAGLTDGVQSARQAFQDFDHDVKRVADNFSSSAQSLADMVNDNRQGVKESVQKVKEVLDEMSDAAQRLKKLVEKLEKGEGSLGRAIAEPDLYNEAKEAVAEVRSTVEPLSKMRPLADAGAVYYPTSKLWKGALTLGLTLGSGPFVLGQVVRDPFQERFTYSFELGQRWGSFAPRVGVIESDFGLGLDYYALQDRLQLSLEGYDFNRSPRPRLRLTSRFSFVKSVFLVLGLDDMILEKQRELFFGLGVGLR